VQGRRLHGGGVHRAGVLHVSEAAAAASRSGGEVVVVTPRREPGQGVRRAKHRQSHRG